MARISKADRVVMQIAFTTKEVREYVFAHKDTVTDKHIGYWLMDNKRVDEIGNKGLGKIVFEEALDYRVGGVAHALWRRMIGTGKFAHHKLEIRANGDIWAICKSGDLAAMRVEGVAFGTIEKRGETINGAEEE